MMKRTKKVLIVALASVMVLGSATAFTSCEAVEGILGNIPFLSDFFGTEETENDKVTNDMVGLQIKTSPTKTKYVVGEKFDPAGMVLTATYKNGDVKDIVVSANNVTYKTAPLTAADTVIRITYKGFTVEQTITLANGVFIEAETGTVVAVNATFPTDSADASGGQYVGNFAANDSITFYFNSDKAGTGDITFRLASQYLKESGGEANWHPILMGDCQLNKICEIYINDVKYSISDDAWLPGSGVSGGAPNDDLWCVWKEVKLTNFSFVAGTNELKLQFIRHDYTDTSQASFSGVFGANVDCLIVTSDDCKIAP